MDQKQIRIKTALLPKLIGDLTHSNQFLKMFSLCSLGVALLSLMLTFVLGGKSPTVLAFDSGGNTLGQTEMPSPEDQARNAINTYVSHRYNWTPAVIKEKLKIATHFILPKSLKVFEGAMADVLRFAIEKDVSQRAYPEQIKISYKDGTALILGARVTSIQGLKTAGDLKILLQFESGPRTLENPWGIYVVKEREE